jgi:cellulose synthase/poly-beta-1,6-N-acetylglucosamine synthase-like glycosyltransferase
LQTEDAYGAATRPNHASDRAPDDSVEYYVDHPSDVRGDYYTDGRGDYYANGRDDHYSNGRDDQNGNGRGNSRSGRPSGVRPGYYPEPQRDSGYRERGSYPQPRPRDYNQERQPSANGYYSDHPSGPGYPRRRPGGGVGQAEHRPASYPPASRPLPYVPRRPPGPSDDTMYFRVALQSLGPRYAKKLYHRLMRWRPRYRSLVIAFLLVGLPIVWFSMPYGGRLTWPLTVLWTWPLLNTVIGIRGIHRARKNIRRSKDRWNGDRLVVCEDALLVVVPTIGRHDVYPALERCILSYIAFLPRCFPRLRIDIITEEGCEAEERISRLASRSPLVRVVTIPASYRTANGTKFKARANHYSHELRIYERENRDDVWVLHMDDDTAVGPDTANAMARLIEEQFQAGPAAKHLAQGILTYPRECAVNRLTWLADSIRPADDIARFSAFTGSGTPRAGLHGELLLIRASIESTIGWDFGPRSIVEDAQFALIFCTRYKGRSTWFGGRCYGASPATVRDFVRQRERWSWGLIGLAFNRSLPLRLRVYLAYSVVSWVCGPLQNVFVVLAAAIALADFNTSPVSLLIVPIWILNFAYIIWMYWEGLRLNGGASSNGRRKFWEPFAVIALIPIFGLMEGAGGLRGFLKFVRRAENRFTVIAKPS